MIHVKQHYRTINGKLVLVHEHQKEGEAQQHAPASAVDATDAEYHKLFGHHHQPEEAPKPKSYDEETDDEFAKIAGNYEQDTSNEFDKIAGQYGGTGEPKPSDDVEQYAPPKEEPKQSSNPTEAEMLGIGGSPWNAKGHDRIYFNGVYKMIPGAAYQDFKGAKVWFDNKDGQFHTKGLDEHHANMVIEAIKKKAKEWGTQNNSSMPDATAVDSEPKIGDTHVPFDKLKAGMVFHGQSSIQEVVKVFGDEVVFYDKGNNKETPTPKKVWDFVSDSFTLKEIKPADSSNWIAFKPGDKVPSGSVKVGMKFKVPSGAIYTIGAGTTSDDIEVVASDGAKHTVAKSAWDDSVSLVYDGMSNDIPKHERGNGAKIGDTPTSDQLKPGMVVKKPGATNIIVATSDDKIWAQSLNGFVHEYTKAGWDNGAASSGIKYEGMDDGSETDNNISAGLKVGDTKVINGKTYRLNENHRWELVDENETPQNDSLADKLGAMMAYDTEIHNNVWVKKLPSGNFIVKKNDEDGKPLAKKVKDALKELHPEEYKTKKSYFLVSPGKVNELAEALGGKASAKPKPPSAPKVAPAPMPQGFPYKKIGEQKGSNPGGLYEDKLGKKWYIKFPQSESHVKNELLASKLYTMAGIAAPKLKIVNDGGKIGIASAFQEGLTNSASALQSGAPGAKEGFGVDAWLANWDSAGLSFDNMPVDSEGKAVRIDVGGSLLYRAQGGPKGDAFGNTVPEIDTLRDASKNSQTASIFGKMSQDEINKSVASVLSIPDDAIKAAVDKWGPGDDAEKKALASKLIARKQYLAKRFPEADAIANPPAPDPTRLPIDETKLPPKVDFHNYNGTGKGLSSKEWKNAANQKAFDDLYASAMRGDLIAFKNYEYKEINPDTGEPTGKTKKISEGHPNKDISSFYSAAVDYMETIAYPSAKKVEGWLPEDVEDVQSLSESFPSEPFGVTVGDVSHEKRLGFWISLGEVSEPKLFMPAKMQNMSDAARAQGKQDYAKMPYELKSWLGNVQGSGSANIGDNKASAAHKKIAKMAYEHATEIPEGTKLRRWLHMPAAMQKLIATASEGHVFENPRSSCTSMNPSWESSGTHFGNVMLEIVHAKGAKGLATYASGSFNSEQEITSLPGQRYMLLSKGTASNGQPKYTVLALPPDPTYVSQLGL